MEWRISRWLARNAGLAWPGTLVVALVVRELFSFWTGHPYDFEIWIRTGREVSLGRNPYISFWPPVPGLSINYVNGVLPSAAYPPFWPLVAGGLFESYRTIGFGNRFVLYWMLKQPPILGDVLAGYLLYTLARRWSATPEIALTILWFWAIFPYDVLISAIWGQFDSIVLCVLLAMLLAGEASTRAVLEGLGIFIKWVTVIFLPLEFFRNRGYRRLWPVVGVLIPISLTLLVFWGMHWGLTGIQATATSESQGGVGGMNYARILTISTIEKPVSHAVPGLYTALSYLWVPVVIVVGWWASRRLPLNTPYGELAAMSLVVAAFLLVRFSLNEQYLLYLFPLMLLDVGVFHPGRARLFAALWLSCLAFLILNNTFGIWFLSPIQLHAYITANQFNQGLYPGAHWFSAFRSNLLDVLALVVSVLLAQVVLVVAQSQDRPRPWLYAWVHWLRDRRRQHSRRGPDPSPTEPASAGEITP